MFSQNIVNNRTRRLSKLLNCVRIILYPIRWRLKHGSYRLISYRVTHIHTDVCLNEVVLFLFLFCIRLSRSTSQMDCFVCFACMCQKSGSRWTNTSEMVITKCHLPFSKRWLSSNHTTHEYSFSNALHA